jgi:hypothetical protein
MSVQAITNGYPNVRMWWVGTKRIFGIGGGEGEEIIPEEISSKLTADGLDVFGDYVVCPLSEYVQGHMQWVCVDSGRNFRIEGGSHKSQ